MSDFVDIPEEQSKEIVENALQIASEPVNETIFAEGGDRDYDGGEGYDYIDFSRLESFGFAGGVLLDLALSSSQPIGTWRQSFAGFEGAVGTRFGDAFYGNAVSNTFYGGDGADIFSTGATASGQTDYYYGGTGDDTVRYEADTPLSFSLGDGFDTVEIGAGITFQTTWNLGDAERFFGGSAREVVSYSLPTTTAVFLYGGGGDDYLRASNGDDTLEGGEGNDELWAYGGANALKGDAGDDVMIDGGGQDAYDGGAGVDGVSYYYAAGSILVDMNQGRVETADGKVDTLSGVETIYGSAYGDVLIGSDQDETFYGNGGDDSVEGGGGSDTLFGGAGYDIAYFSGLVDDYDIDVVNDVISVTDLRDGSPDGVDTVVQFEALMFDDGVLTGAGFIPRSVNLFEDLAGDAIEASGFNEGQPFVDGNVLDNDEAASLLTVTGVAAADASVAVNGVTEIMGEYGRLLISPDGFFSYALDNQRPATDALGAGEIVYDQFTYQATNIWGDTQTSSLRIEVVGSSETAGILIQGTEGRDEVGYSDKPDALLYTEGDDVIETYGGDDSVQGGGGDDLIYAGYGWDQVFGGSGDDEIHGYSGYYFGDDGDDVILAGGYLWGGAGDDILTGGWLSDALYGGEGADRLDGADGDDRVFLDFQGAPSGVTYTHQRSGVVETAHGVKTLASIEGVMFRGSEFDDVVTGGTGLNEFDGGGGNDRFIGGSSYDVVTLSFEGATRGVTYEHHTDGQAVTPSGTVTFTGVESASITGSDFDDHITLGDAPSAFASGVSGGEGDDVLTAKIGGQYLDGGAGDDRLVVGVGAEYLEGGSGTDVAEFSGALADYSFARSDDGVVATRHDSPLNTTSLTGVEFLKFSDQTLAIDHLPQPPNKLVRGLGGEADFGELVAPRNDDGSVFYDISAAFPSGLAIGGSVYSEIYVNTNGNITFGQGLSDYTPDAIAGNPIGIIAPFWADIDTRDASIPSAPIYVDIDAATSTVTVTWAGVNAFPQNGDAQDYFQLQLVDRGAGNFDIIFRYDDIQWANGARAGFNIGDGVNVFELPQSGFDYDMLGLETAAGNTGAPGMWLFEVRGGVASQLPVATDDHYQISEDGVLHVGAAAGVLANDVDPDGDALSVFDVVQGPAHGVVVVNPDGSFEYRPNANFNGEDSFVYGLTNITGRATPGYEQTFGAVTVNVTAVQDAPTAMDDAGFTATYNNPIGISIASLIANDYDVDGDAFNLVSVGGAAHGQVAIQSGQVIFTPTNGYQGAASFSYTIQDATGLASTGAVSLQVIGPAGPTAVADSGFEVVYNKPVTIPIARLLSNDRDADGDTFGLSSVDGATHGSVSIQGDNVVFVPEPDYHGPASFSYTITDGAGLSSSTVVDLAVAAGDVRLSVSVDDALAPGDIGTAKVHLTDPTGAPLSATLLVLDGNGALVQDPLTGQFGDTALIFMGGSSTSSLDLSVAVRMSGTADTYASVSASIADPAATIDWASRKDTLKPADMSSEAWDRIFDNFVDAVGSTVGSLTQAMAANANLLASHGMNGGSGAAALAFEIEQAGDFGSIAARSHEGALGIGWASTADLALEVGANGVAILHGLADFARIASFEAGASGLYTVSSSVGRAVGLNGALATPSSAIEARFVRGVDGRYDATSASGLALKKTSTGYVVRDGDGNALRFDGAGVLLSVVLIDGTVINAATDAEGRVTGFSGPNAHTLAFTRAADGHVTAIEAGEGGSVILTASPDGDQLIAAQFDNGHVGFGYNAQGDLNAITPDGVAPVTIGYDAEGRLAAIDVGTAGSLDVAYTATGGYRVTDAGGGYVDVSLLPGGVVGSVTDAAGVSQSLRFDDHGRVAGISNPNGTSTDITFDALGRATAVTDANGATIHYQYEGEGQRPTGFTDASGETKHFVYDQVGKLTAVEWPDGTQLAFSFDGNGNVVGRVTRAGEAITYDYDAAGHLIAASDSSSGPLSYSYDAAGRLASITDNAGVTSLSYDAQGHITAIGYPNGRSLAYTYDEAGHRTSMIDQDGRIQTYVYDAAGRLSEIGDGTSALVSYAYDTSGRLAHEQNGNGTTTTYAYDLAGRVTDIVNKDADDAVHSFNHYTYDATGLRSGMTTQDGAWVYGYDAMGQLTSASFDSSNPDIADKTLSYTYDGAGNRLSATEDGVTTPYVVDAMNRYVSMGDTSFTYDPDGNVATRTDASGTTYYSFDINNRLIGVTGPDGATTAYEYNAFGNRSASVENGVRTEFLVDPFGLGDLVSEYGSGGNLNVNYFYGAGLASAVTSDGIPIYYDTDGIGSVSSITGSGGIVLNSYAYAPFGGELGEHEIVDNRFEFNGILGVQEDSNDLLYMRARYYGNEFGRFVSEDPLILDGDVSNLYRFSSNSPTNISDPSGLKGVWQVGVGFSGAAPQGLARGIIGNLGVGITGDDHGNIGLYFTSGVGVNLTDKGKVGSAFPSWLCF